MLSLLLAVPSCIYSFWHGVIPTFYFMIFILLEYGGTPLDTIGSEESVLFREVSLFQGCPYRGAPLYTTA